MNIAYDEQKELEEIKKELGKTGQKFLNETTKIIDKVIKKQGYISDMRDDNQIEYLSEYNAHRYINKEYSNDFIDTLCEHDMYESTFGEIETKFNNLIKEHLNNKYNLIHEKSKTDDMYEYKRYYYTKDLHFANINEFEKHFNINQDIEVKNKELENQKVEKENPKSNKNNNFIKQDIISIIKDNVEIIDYAKNIGLTPVRQGNDRYSLKEYDSVVITPSKRKYIRNSNGDIGKSVIDFAMEFRGLRLKEAIVELKKYVPSYYLENNNINKENKLSYPKEDKQTIQKEKEEKEEILKELILPSPSLKAHKKMFAYLSKSRKIDKQVIDNLYKRKMIYQDEKGNISFVGYNKEIKAHKKMFAYLSKSRKIDKQVIDNLYKRKMIYQDEKGNISFVGYNKENKADFVFQRGTNTNKPFKKVVSGSLYKRKMIYQDEKGNISFVGYNKENKADFVFQRGTNTNKPFKKVVSGSSFETAFFVDNNSYSIFITEAIIDNMSIMTMLLHNNIDFTNYNYLSLCGTCTKSINTYIKDNEKISTVYICVDNDNAGENLREKIDKMLKDIGFKGDVIHKRPINKDFNEDLQKLKEMLYTKDL